MSTKLLEKPKRRRGGAGTVLGGSLVRPKAAPPADPSPEAGPTPPTHASRRPAKATPGKARDADLVALCRHLAALYGTGITVAEALRTFAEEAPNPRFGVLLREVVEDLEAGRSLSEALDRHPKQFSAHFRASIWAGESSGTMGQTLDRLAGHLEDRAAMRQRVRNAFAYPVVVSVMIIGVTSFLVMYVVPVFANVYRKMNVDLPLVTRMLLGFSQVVTAHPWMPVVALAVVLAAVVYVRRTPAARVACDRLLVRLPVVGSLAKRLCLYRFVRTFGEMMGAGVPVLEGLDLAAQVAGNRAFGEAIAGVRDDIERGLGLTETFRRTGWFPPSLLQVVHSGEQSGRVAALLDRAADMLERDLDLVMKRTVSRLEPILTVSLALVVGFILVAVYLPMFDVMQHVGQ